MSPAAADPLQAAGQDEDEHGRRQGTGDRAEDEHRDGDQDGDPPAVSVAELPVEGRHGGGGEEIDGHHPGQVLEVAELAADGRQRRGDDGLVERCEQHRQHDAEDDPADLGLAQRLDPAGPQRLSRRLIHRTLRPTPTDLVEPGDPVPKPGCRAAMRLPEKGDPERNA